MVTVLLVDEEGEAERPAGIACIPREICGSLRDGGDRYRQGITWVADEL